MGIFNMHKQEVVNNRKRDKTIRYAALYKKKPAIGPLVSFMLDKEDSKESDFKGTNLSNVDLTAADLSKADFTASYFIDAIFLGTNLEETNFERVNITNAQSLTANQLAKACINQIIVDHSDERGNETIVESAKLMKLNARLEERIIQLELDEKKHQDTIKQQRITIAKLTNSESQIHHPLLITISKLTATPLSQKITNEDIVVYNNAQEYDVIKERVIIHQALYADSNQRIQSAPSLQTQREKTMLKSAILPESKVAPAMSAAVIAGDYKDNKHASVVAVGSAPVDLKTDIKIEPTAEFFGADQKLIDASVAGDSKQVEALFREVINKNAKSKAFLAAARYGHNTIVDYFIRQDFDLAVSDEEGNTVLHLATCYGHRTLVDLLLRNGFQHNDINNKNNQQVLHVAAFNNRAEIVSDLLKSGAHTSGQATFNFNNHEMKLIPIEVAVHRGYSAIVELLIPHVLMSDRHLPAEGNLLHLAVLARRDDMLAFLLNHPEICKKMLDELNANNFSPLALAAAIGNVRAIKLLSDRGAKSNIKDPNQETALFAAVRNQQFDAIDALATIGADLDVRNKDNNSADQLAGQLAKEMKSTDEKQHNRYLRISKRLQQIRDEKTANRYTPFDFKKTRLRNLVWKGGGPKGIAYVGALRALETIFTEQKRSLSEELERIAGASAGAITALLCALNYNSDDVEKILKATKMSSFVEGVDVNHLKGAGAGALWEWCKASYRKGGSSWTDYLRPLKLMYNLDGLCKGEVFRTWLENDVIKVALKRVNITQEHLTFGELRALIQEGKPFKHLYVVATKITGNPQIVVFNSEDALYDNFIIADAVRASMSIPGVFTPYKVRIKASGVSGPQLKEMDEQYADGGLLKNYPVDIFDKVKYQEHTLVDQKEFPIFNRQTLGFKLIGQGEDKRAIDKPKDIQNLKELGCTLASVYAEAENVEAALHGHDVLRTVNIDNCGVSLLDFDLTEKRQQELIKSGEKAVRASAFFNDAKEQAIPMAALVAKFSPIMAPAAGSDNKDTKVDAKAEGDKKPAVPGTPVASNNGCCVIS